MIAPSGEYSAPADNVAIECTISRCSQSQTRTFAFAKSGRSVHPWAVTRYFPVGSKSTAEK